MTPPKLIIHLDINGTIMPADPIKAQHVCSMLNIHLSKQAFVRRDEKGDITWWDGTHLCATNGDGAPPPLLPQLRYKRHIREHYKDCLVEDADAPLENTTEFSTTSMKHIFEESISLDDYRNVVSSGIGCADFTCSYNPGSVYAPQIAKLLKALEWKHEYNENIDQDIVDKLTITIPLQDDSSNSTSILSDDGLEGIIDNDSTTSAPSLVSPPSSPCIKRMNLFVPSFLSLIKWLNEKHEGEFVIVIRTFGGDIPRLIPAFALIADGRHPDLPQSDYIHHPSWIGSMNRRAASATEGYSFLLDLKSLLMKNNRNSSEVRNQLRLEGPSEILAFIEKLPNRSVVFINDDYDTWKQHRCDPVYGKPIFLNLDKTHEIQHFLFDDNINVDTPFDSIASVWLAESRVSKNSSCNFSPVPQSTPQGMAMIGTVLLQANLFNSIMNKNAFVDELQRALARYKSLKTRLTAEEETIID